MVKHDGTCTGLTDNGPRIEEMNLFIAVMVFFAALGLIDMILGNKLGVAPDFEQGLTTMGGLSLSVVGFYSIGVSFVQNYAEQISAATASLPFDPSLIIGSLLAPDMGALGVAVNLAATPELAAFTGALVAGGLGMTIGYQLPVFLAAVRKEEIPELMRGFIFGLIALPPGLLAGGLIIGLPLPVLFVNMIPVLILCVLLIAAFLLAPGGTMKVLIVFGNFVRVVSFVFFALSIVGLFSPEHAIVDSSLVKDSLYMILRMVIVACGGLVMSHLILDHFGKVLGNIGSRLHTNNESVVGILLSSTQSLAMLPLFSRMDKRGQVLNAAFSVCGAYVVGGQMAAVSSMVTGRQTTAYMICKLISGFLGVALAALFYREEK